MSRSVISFSRSSAHDQGQMNFTTTLIKVSTTRARASVWWVRAELARYKASTNNWALAASLFPPAKKIRRPMTVQAQVVKWVEWLRHEGMQRPRYTRHDNKWTEAVEKNKVGALAKMAVNKSSSPSFLFFNWTAFDHGHAGFFSSAVVNVWRDLCSEAWTTCAQHSASSLKPEERRLMHTFNQQSLSFLAGERWLCALCPSGCQKNHCSLSSRTKKVKELKAPILHLPIRTFLPLASQ